MTCEEARRALSRRADGVLPPAEEQALGSHLEGCAVCRSFQTLLAGVSDLFRAMPRPAAPEDMSDRVLGALNGKRAQIIALGPFLKRATVAAAVVLLASTTAIFVWPGPTKSRPVDVSRKGALELIMNRIAREQIVYTKEGNR